MGESQKPQTPPPVRFITDEPAEKDSFDTHSKLAAAIAEAILTNAELKVIGLLGRWGSGKSTVIKYLSTEVEKRAPSRFKVFTYDAWLHQNDPPRRSFLDNLVASLDADGLIDNERWQTELKFLSGVLEKEDKVETPVLTNDAKFLFLSLLPVPIALSLISVDTIAGAFGANQSLAAVWSFWLAIGMIAFPVLAWPSRVLYLRWYKKRQAEWFPPFLISRHLGRKSTLVERSPNPGSLEFGQRFQDLMIEVSQKDKKLIIVIDNIDRVGDEDALEIWSNIRSFFLASHRTNIIGHEPFHPLVILPVDDGAIKKLFEQRGGTADAADSFISKTFDASFTVPTPVMSDWRAFLADQLKYAFGSRIKEYEIFHIRSFMEAYLKFRSNKQTPKALTPREINRFVNSVASLFLQWRDTEIGIVASSYFAIFRSQVSDNIMGFVLSPNDLLESVEPNWQQKIAALYFGVSLDKAAQVLLEEPLISSINEYEMSSFDGYAAIPGFGEVFSDMTSPYAGSVAEDKGQAWFYLNAAALLARMDRTDAPVWMKQAWSNLEQSIAKSVHFLDASKVFGERLTSVIPLISQSAVSPIAASVGIILIRFLEADNAWKDVSVAKDILVSIIERSDNPEEDVIGLTIKSTPEHFIRLLIAFDGNPEIQKRFTFEPKGDDGNFGQALSSLARDPDMAKGLPAIVEMLSVEDNRANLNIGDIDWQPLISDIADLAPNADSLFSQSRAVLPLIGHLAVTGDAAINLASAGVDQSWVSARLAEALQKGDESAIAAGYALLIWRVRDVPKPGSSWREHLRKYRALIDTTIKFLHKLNGGVTIEPIADSYADHYGSRDLLRAILMRQIELKDLGSIYPDKISKNFFRYYRIIPSSMKDDLLELLLGYKNFEENLGTAPWGEGLNSVADHLAKQGVKKGKEVRRTLIKRLVDSTGEDLLGALENGDEPFSRITKMHNDSSLNLPVESGPYRILESYAPKICSSSDPIVDRWFDLLRTIQMRKQKLLVNLLLGSILEMKECPSLYAILDHGARSLLSSGQLSDHPNSAIYKILLPALRRKGGRAVAKRYKRSIARWVHKADQRAEAKLRMRLTKLIGSPDKERSGFARAVRADWVGD